MGTYFRPDIRVGYKLAAKDFDYEQQGSNQGMKTEDWHFYVEGVGHNLVYPGVSSTTVTVTRGRNATDELFNSDLDWLKGKGEIAQLGDTLDRIKGDIVP